MHDMRLKPGTGSTANHIATNVVVLLSGMELLVIIFLAAVLGFVSDELSHDRRGGGVMIALGFIPVTFFALIIAGQMLAGVSL